MSYGGNQKLSMAALSGTDQDKAGQGFQRFLTGVSARMDNAWISVSIRVPKAL